MPGSIAGRQGGCEKYRAALVPHTFFAIRRPMAKLLKTYVCQSCGAASSKWQGQCADCGSWNTMVEESAPAASPFAQKHHLQTGVRRLSLAPLNVSSALPKRLSPALGHLALSLGWGLVSGSATLFGALPCFVNSTLPLPAPAVLS